MCHPPFPARLRRLTLPSSPFQCPRPSACADRPLAGPTYDKWTFSSRAGTFKQQRQQPLTTTWTFESISKSQRKVVPLVVVHFAFDDPHEVQARDGGEHVEVFSLSRQRRTAHAREPEGAGRAFE